MEHQFGTNWLARAAYVGSESDHQSIATDVNYGRFFGDGDPNNGARSDPNFGQVLIDVSSGTANYQSGQFTLERRFAHGLQFQANYTYSKTIDWAAYAATAFTSGVYDYRCLPCNRANSFLDVPHVFTANFVYETPTLTGWNSATKQILGGWEVSGIVQIQSGNPFTITSGHTTSWDNRGIDYPNYASGTTSVSTHPGDLTHYLDPANFELAPQGSKGGIGRNPTGAFNPGINKWDLNLSKNFRFAERYRFQIRWEMFNAFNRVTFAGPGANFSSGQFGLINSTNSNFPARVMELAGKFFF